MKHLITINLVIALLLTAVACKKDEISVGAFQVKRSLLGCSDYRVASLGDRSYEHLAQHGEFFLYAGLPGIGVTQGFGGPMVMEVPNEAIGVPNFFRHDGRMFIHGSSVLYEFTEDGRLLEVLDVQAKSMAAAPDGRLLLSRFFHADVWELNPVTWQATPYISDGSSPGSSLRQLTFSPDGQLWALDYAGGLLQFDGSDLVARHTARESDFWGHKERNPSVRTAVLLTHEDGIIAVGQRSEEFLKVLRYEDGAWATLFLLAPAEEPAERRGEALSFLSGSELRDAKVIDGKLYLCMTGGLLEIDLAKGPGLGLDDVLNIRDPELPRNGGIALYQGQDGVWYLLNSLMEVVRLGC